MIILLLLNGCVVSIEVIMKIRKIFTVFLLMMVISSNYTIVKGEEKPLQYDVIDLTNNEVIGSFDSGKKASAFFAKKSSSFDNLIIKYNDKVLKASYGIVKVNSNDACDVNVEFRNVVDNGSNYINGCYGVDGAYLDTNDSLTTVTMMISSVVGKFNIKDVDIIPLSMIDQRLSSYFVRDNHLIHQIKQSFRNDIFSSFIELDVAPSYLIEGKEYISYDGHYFYESDQVKVMLDDYRNNTNDNSINKDNPYYNYYQFVSHRQLTNASIKEISDYFSDRLMIEQGIDIYLDLDKDSANDTMTSSQFYQQADTFMQYQYEYGANALMMIALASNESAVGRSSLAFTRNNLFGHAAYDSDVEKNASRYFNVQSSIYSHAKYYLSGSYCNPMKFQYQGGFFGNKSNGMNVNYASDPYWGEKAAQYYFKIDEALGFKDRQKNTLAIKTSNDSVSVYAQPYEDSMVMYRTGIMKDYSFIVLEEVNNQWLKIQSDATLSSDYHVALNYMYDFTHDIGYIRKNDVQLMLKGTQELHNDFVKVSFNAGDGQFINKTNEVSYYIEKGNIPVIEHPTKEKALFKKWDKAIKEVKEDTVFTAEYSDVDRIELLTTGKTYYEINDRIDIKGASLKVYFTDGNTSTLPVTTSMIRGYDLKVAGQQAVEVEYAGCTASYPIFVDEPLDTIRKEIKEEIVSLIEQLQTSTSLTDDDKNRILTLKSKMDQAMVPYLTQSQLRDIDRLIKMANGDELLFRVEKNKLDLSVSGLSLAIKNEPTTKKYFKDLIKISTGSIINNESIKKVKHLAEGIEHEVVSTFSVSLTKDAKPISIQSPILISIKKPEGFHANQWFTVMRVNGEEIVKCYTRQTDNYIQFVTADVGEFVLLTRMTTNQYHFDDVIENVTVANSAEDKTPFYIGLSLMVLSGLYLLIELSKRMKHYFNEKKLKQEVHVLLEEQQEGSVEEIINEEKVDESLMDELNDEQPIDEVIVNEEVEPIVQDVLEESIVSTENIVSNDSISDMEKDILRIEAEIQAIQAEIDRLQKARHVENLVKFEKERTLDLKNIESSDRNDYKIDSIIKDILQEDGDKSSTEE